jgi:cell division protein FtsL
MKPSGLSNKLVFMLPVFCVLASAGIVTQQTIRRNRLQSELTAYEKEHSALDKRYRELSKAAGKPIPAEADSSDEHHHHDGD